jgi:hypothetical protein
MRDKAAMSGTSTSTDACMDKMLTEQVSIVHSIISVACPFLLVFHISMSVETVQIQIWVSYTDLCQLLGHPKMLLVWWGGNQEAGTIGDVDIILWMFHFKLLRREITIQYKCTSKLPSV